MAGAKKDGIGGEGGDIRDLFSYNLQRLAGVSTRIALLDIKPQFELNMHDWRALVQKSQMSRTTAALQERALIARQDNPRDKRSTLLRLTEEGKAVVRAVLETSHDRNRRMLAYLDEAERIQLMALMEKATRGSLELLADLKGHASEGDLQTPEPSSLFETEPM